MAQDRRAASTKSWGENPFERLRRRQTQELSIAVAVQKSSWQGARGRAAMRLRLLLQPLQCLLHR